MNGLSNRQPQFRYTWVGAGGISVAGIVEQTGVGALRQHCDPGRPPDGPRRRAINRYPDFIVKGRWDQGWGHLSLAGALREQEVIAVGCSGSPKVGWGVFLSGHFNTFGKEHAQGRRAMFGPSAWPLPQRHVYDGVGLADGHCYGNHRKSRWNGAPISPTRIGGPMKLRSTLMGWRLASDSARRSSPRPRRSMASTIASRRDHQSGLEPGAASRFRHRIRSRPPHYRWTERGPCGSQKARLNRIEAEGVFKF